MPGHLVHHRHHVGADAEPWQLTGGHPRHLITHGWQYGGVQEEDGVQVTHVGHQLLGEGGVVLEGPGDMRTKPMMVVKGGKSNNRMDILLLGNSLASNERFTL